VIVMRIAGQALWMALVLFVPARDALPASGDFSGKVVGGTAVTLYANF